jgi:hypothetical protein
MDRGPWHKALNHREIAYRAQFTHGHESYKALAGCESLWCLQVVGVPGILAVLIIPLTITAKDSSGWKARERPEHAGRKAEGFQQEDLRGPASSDRMRHTAKPATTRDPDQVNVNK